MDRPMATTLLILLTEACGAPSDQPAAGDEAAKAVLSAEPAAEIDWKDGKAALRRERAIY